MRGLKPGENEDLIMMTAFQKAEVLAGQRYDRDHLLAVVGEVTTHFRMPQQLREIEDAGSMSIPGRCSRSLQRINSATALERLRGEVLVEVEVRDQPSRWYLLDLGRTRPNIRADDRSESGNAGQCTRQPVGGTLARRSPARAATPCAARSNCCDNLDFIV